MRTDLTFWRPGFRSHYRKNIQTKINSQLDNAEDLRFHLIRSIASRNAAFTPALKTPLLCR